MAAPKKASVGGLDEKKCSPTLILSRVWENSESSMAHVPRFTNDFIDANLENSFVEYARLCTKNAENKGNRICMTQVRSRTVVLPFTLSIGQNGGLRQEEAYKNAGPIWQAGGRRVSIIIRTDYRPRFRTQAIFIGGSIRSSSSVRGNLATFEWPAVKDSTDPKPGS
jgi:hypothetical protein